MIVYSLKVRRQSEEDQRGAHIPVGKTDNRQCNFGILFFKFIFCCAGSSFLHSDFF